MTTESKMTGKSVRELRLSQKKTLDEFWLPMGITRGMGSNYELNRSCMSNKVQHLIWLHHIATPTQALKALGKKLPRSKEK